MAQIYLFKFNQDNFGDNDFFSKNCLSKKSINKPVKIFDTKRNVIGECFIDSDEIGVFIKELKNLTFETLDLSQVGFGFKNLDNECLPRSIIGFDTKRYIKNIEIKEIIKK